MTCNDVDECDKTGKDRVCDNASCQNSDEFYYRKTSISLLNKHLDDSLIVQQSIEMKLV